MKILYRCTPNASLGPPNTKMKWNDDPFIINYYLYLIKKYGSMSDDDVVVLSLVLLQGIAVFVC